MLKLGARPWFSCFVRPLDLHLWVRQQYQILGRAPFILHKHLLGPPTKFTTLSTQPLRILPQARRSLHALDTYNGLVAFNENVIGIMCS
jgi:hypothetical protein